MNTNRSERPFCLTQVTTKLLFSSFCFFLFVFFPRSLVQQSPNTHRPNPNPNNTIFSLSLSLFMAPLSSRGSTHTTVARGTALWESLVGRPSGKALGKATDPLIHAKGSVTLLLQLGRKAHVHAPA